MRQPYRNVSRESLFYEGDEFAPGTLLSEAAVQDRDWLGEHLAAGRVARVEE